MLVKVVLVVRVYYMDNNLVVVPSGRVRSFVFVFVFVFVHTMTTALDGTRRHATDVATEGNTERYARDESTHANE